MSRLTTVLVAIFLSACSSTLNYEAIGYFSYQPERGYNDQKECRQISNENCKKISINWKTERFCGLYLGADDRTSEINAFVSGSDIVQQNWETIEEQTLLIDYDEEFEWSSSAPVERAKSDLICGKFEPGQNLVDVKNNDELNLLINCQYANRGQKFIPASKNTYLLSVNVVSEDKFLLGCKK